VPTVLSAIAFWWIYDSQFSIISWSLIKIGSDQPQHQFSFGDGQSAWPAAAVDLRQYLARACHSSRFTLAGRPCRTVSPIRCMKPATLDGAHQLGSAFRFITYPILTPIIAVVMTFLGAVHGLPDFQLVWGADAWAGPGQTQHT